MAYRGVCLGHADVGAINDTFGASIRITDTTMPMSFLAFMQRDKVVSNS